MKKNNFSFIIASLSALLFLSTGCDKVNEAISKELTMREKSFKLPVIVEMKGTGETYIKFEAKYDGLNLDNEIFKDLQEYKDAPLELVLNKATVKFDKLVNTTGGNAVRNLKATAIDADEDTTLASFVSPENEDIILENGYKELTPFLQVVVRELQHKKTMNITASGETNMIPQEGESGIILGNLVVTMEIYAKIKL